MANDAKVVQKLSFSDTFYSNAFKKLEAICNMANGLKSCYAYPDEALLEFTAFMTTLPRELKEKMKPLQDQALDSVTKHGKIPLEPQYFDSLREKSDYKKKPPDKEFLNNCYNWVLKLVNEVSSLLHESKDNLTLFGLNQADDKSKENPRSRVE